MTDVLKLLTGRQVASLMLCATYTGPGRTATYGFSRDWDGPALEALGLVERRFSGAYRATARGKAAVACLGHYDRFAADMLGDLPYRDRPKFEADINSAWTTSFAEARAIERRIQGGTR